MSAKQNLATLFAHIAGLLHARLPANSFEDCVWARGRDVDLGCGISPAVNSPPAVVEAPSRPELAAMQPVFEREVID